VSIFASHSEAATANEKLEVKIKKEKRLGGTNAEQLGESEVTIKKEKGLGVMGEKSELRINVVIHRSKNFGDTN
jgi:hypothetical protein